VNGHNNYLKMMLNSNREVNAPQISAAKTLTSAVIRTVGRQNNFRPPIRESQEITILSLWFVDITAQWTLQCAAFQQLEILQKAHNQKIAHWLPLDFFKCFKITHI